MTLSSPYTPAEFKAYFDLRWRILRKPWRQPQGSEQDGHEVDAFHVMATDDTGVILGAGRLHVTGPDAAQIRYMAVEDGYRGRGIGTLVLDELERIASENGIREIVLNARVESEGFYLKKGYRTLGPAHTLFGEVRHVRMVKVL